MPVALVNGVRLNYLQTEEPGGETRPDLLMVHGLATNMAFWYLPYAPIFAQRFRVTLYDLRGLGRSEMTPDGSFLSLPMYPELTPEQIQRVVTELRDCMNRRMPKVSLTAA